MIWLAEEDTYYLLYDDYLLPSLDLLPSTSGGSLQIVRGPLDLEPGAGPNHRTGKPHRRDASSRSAASA